MLTIRRLVFELSGKTPMRLHPAVPSATIRGALGYALLQVSAQEAALNMPGRAQWILNHCYANNAGGDSSVKPMVLRGRFARPDKRAFLLECLLFGTATPYGSTFRQAVNIMADMGLGGERPQACRTRLLADETVYPDPSIARGDCLMAEFLSPARIAGRQVRCLSAAIPFEILVARGLDRLQKLADTFGNGFPSDLNIAAIKRKAATVLSFPIQANYISAARSSTRSRDSVSISGFVGTMLYRGDLPPFSVLLAYLPWIHAGRGAVQGCGWISLRNADSPEATP
jgi:hypothetical protein